MKKLLMALLALSLVCTMAVPAFAADVTGATIDKQPDPMDVTATYQAGTAAGKVYSVDITWDDLSFTYTDGAEGAWDPNTLTYGAKGEGSWDKTTANIKVTNKSNAAVQAAFTFAKIASGAEKLTGSFGDKATVTLDAVVPAQEGGSATVDTETVTFTIGGSLDAAVSGNKVGTISITLSAQE